MNIQKILDWLRQPTSVAGLSAMVSVATGLATGQLTWQAAIPLSVGALVAIALPDNAGAKSSAQAVAADVVLAASGDKAALAKVAADGLTLANDLSAK